MCQRFQLTHNSEHTSITNDAVQEFERLAEDRFLVGSPAERIEQTEAMQDRMALEHLVTRFHHSGMPGELLCAQGELFGAELIPAFD